jgi:hypothetical protein
MSASVRRADRAEGQSTDKVADVPASRLDRWQARRWR